VSDYLDKPPQRYKHEFQKYSGSREMVEDADGEWVKFEDMDLYMFEGGQLMTQALARLKVYEDALTKIKLWHIVGPLTSEQGSQLLQLQLTAVAALASQLQNEVSK
jgi:hypothetical protein